MKRDGIKYPFNASPKPKEVEKESGDYSEKALPELPGPNGLSKSEPDQTTRVLVDSEQNPSDDARDENLSVQHD